MKINAQPGRIFRTYALALTIGFLWTDMLRQFPWFEALVDRIAG